ncbi:MAG: MaoC family dehydratase [Peptoniphilaceae bacterium]
MKIKKIEDIKIGDSESFTKTVTESDIYNFAGISGDFNPAHIDDIYAKNSMFKGRIAHGMLVSSFISTVLGGLLPGPGSIYLSQNLKFLKPVYYNDTITAKCTVSKIIKDKNIINLDTTCTNQNDEIVISGEASILLPK